MPFFFAESGFSLSNNSSVKLMINSCFIVLNPLKKTTSISKLLLDRESVISNKFGIPEESRFSKAGNSSHFVILTIFKSPFISKI